VLVAPLAYSQVTHPDDPDSILVGKKKLPKVLLVGSFHFNYPGQDAYVYKESNRVNILSKKRQKELQALLDYISKFKPTKIAVEGGRNSGYLHWRLKEWKKGTRPLKASEIEQIGLRLMHRFKHDTIYGVNDWGLLSELNYERSKNKGVPKTYTDSIYDRHYFGGEDDISMRYTEYYQSRDKYLVSHTLLESFKYLNSDKVLNRGFGAYIAGGQFVSENNKGPDALSTLWMNRNLRIYRNIQKIGYDEDDRILVIFGAGHVSILKLSLIHISEPTRPY